MKSSNRSLESLQQKIGIKFDNINTLLTALTHPTYVFEKRNVREHNQRLEFLGDAVLGMIVAEFLYKNYPNKSEGDLTKLRASLVCESSLAKNARRIDLGDYLFMGKGEDISGGRQRQSILADSYEALVGAIYLDRGLDAARSFVVRDLKTLLNEGVESTFKDYKTLLQELVQKKYNENVSYSILEESGPDHDKNFVAGVFFKGKLLTKGSGKSKKEAEQEAAKYAYSILMDKDNVN
ncbi:MAG TPA: ribonuclease III [Peptococcaceae bacterium]|nr:ribonuclease III [Peptococcaceae bacterium]